MSENIQVIGTKLVVGEHHKENYEKFHHWYLDHYMSHGAVVIPIGDKFSHNPPTIHLQTILWDAWMARESEVQDMKRKIQQLEKNQK
jgi:CRISPR/Cas system-associated endonuclease/helicase Cas3